MKRGLSMMGEQEPEKSRQGNQMTTPPLTYEPSSIEPFQNQSEDIPLIDLVDSDEEEIQTLILPPVSPASPDKFPHNSINPKPPAPICLSEGESIENRSPEPQLRCIFQRLLEAYQKILVHRSGLTEKKSFLECTPSTLTECNFDRQFVLTSSQQSVNKIMPQVKPEIIPVDESVDHQGSEEVKTSIEISHPDIKISKEQDITPSAVRNSPAEENLTLKNGQTPGDCPTSPESPKEFHQISGTEPKNGNLKRFSEFKSPAIPVKRPKIDDASSAEATNNQSEEYSPLISRKDDGEQKVVETSSPALVEEINFEPPVLSNKDASNLPIEQDKNMKLSDHSMHRTDSCYESEQGLSPTESCPKPLSKGQRSAEGAVMNLNVAKLENVSNEFNLEEIYATRVFNFPCRVINANDDRNDYDLRDVVSPKDKEFKRLFEMICWVFSVPMNCGYFNEEERSLVFKILTLSRQKQYFLMEFMMRKKNDWFIARKFFDREMGSYLNEMTEEGFFNKEYHNDESGMFFNRFGIITLKKLCKVVQLPSRASRRSMIRALQEVFLARHADPWSEGQWDTLKNYLDSYVCPIMKLSPSLLSLIHRILTLYYPTHSHDDYLSEIFSKLTKVHRVMKRSLKKNDPSSITHFPLFRNRRSLIDYVTAKLAWKYLLQIVNQEKKNDSHWNKLEAYRKEAFEQLKQLIAEKRERFPGETVPDLPVHIQRFSAVYIWSRILILTSEVSSTKTIAGLNFIIKNLSDIPIKPGELYKTLIRNEIKLKQVEKAAKLTLEASTLKLSSVDSAEIMEIARKLSLKDEGISPEMKQSLHDLLRYPEEKFSPNSSKEVIVRRIKNGKKILWQLNSENEGRRFETIEQVALDHYAGLGFDDSIECAGSLPLTILACLFWDEIYDERSVSDAFFSGFQRTPLDLFDSSFFENRVKVFTLKYRILECGWNCEEVCAIMAKNYDDDPSVESIISHCFGHGKRFEQIIKCLGKKTIIDICKKIMVEGFNDEGFPGLLVWKKKTGEGRLVAIKEPLKNLSVQQKFWIAALESMNANIDVFSVKLPRKSTTLTGVGNSCEG